MNSQTESEQGLKIVAACFFIGPVMALVGLYFDPRLALAAFFLQLIAGLAFIATRSLTGTKTPFSSRKPEIDAAPVLAS
jgi:hypothetical protein